MKKRHLISLIPSLLLSVSANSTASDQNPVISEISKNAYNVTRYLNRSSAEEITSADAEKIKKAILANSVVDDGEARMLKYLHSGQGFTIKGPSAGNSDVTFSRSVSSAAKSVLSTIVSKSFDDPVEEQWERANVADLHALISLYNGSAEGKAKVLDVMSASLSKAYDSEANWEKSNAATKLEIARWSSKLNSLGVSEYGDFKAMLYEAGLKADMNGRDNTFGRISDYHYKKWGQ